MDAKPLKFALCGLGVVGSGVVDTWQKNQQHIQLGSGRSLELDLVAARSNKHGCDLSAFRRSDDIFAATTDPDIEVVVELIGGDGVAYDLVMQALEHGKHVVTANKALLAQHGARLYAQARAHRRHIYFEAAVAGGIPIIKSVTEALAANNITSVSGIINGTCNYILSRLAADGEDFATALAKAQELGFAEADPSFDVGGVDAAHKIAILARLIFQQNIDFEQIYCRGIEYITNDDVAFAAELGYSIKAIASARRDPASGELEFSSQPLLVPKNAPLAAISGVNNAIELQCQPLGALFMAGAGAGAGATASAVLSDLIALSHSGDYACPAFARDLPEARIKGVNLGSGQYFLCLHVLDKIGVLNRISQLLLDCDVSVRNLIQKPATMNGESIAMVALLTHETQERKFERAVVALQQMPELQDRRVHSLRVLA